MFLTTIVRVYNREDTIERCLNSIIQQSEISNIQILIIDDGSSDRSLYIIKDIINNNPSVRIDLVRHETNMGRGKSLNTAKEHIIGKYCCIIDSDDEYINPQWVSELKTEIADKSYSIYYNGNPYSYHVFNIYLSEAFKKCPIPNFNYYEDHYTKYFFFGLSELTSYKYNISSFYKINQDSIDRTNKTHLNEKFKFYDPELKVLYEDTFYYRREKQYDDLVKRCKEFNTSGLHKVLIETYNEIVEELKQDNTNKYLIK